MPPRKRPRASRKLPYLHYKIVGTPPQRRGEVFAPVKAYAKDVERLGFQIDWITGATSRPLFEHVPGKFGEIRERSRARTPNLTGMIRRQQHSAQGVARELNVAGYVAQELARIHQYVIDTPLTRFDSATQTVLAGRFEAKMNEFVQLLRPGATSTPKKEAIRRMQKAIVLMKERNYGALPVSLIGAHNDLGDHHTKLHLQHDRAARTYGAIQAKHREIMDRFRTWLNHTRMDLDVLQRHGIPLRVLSEMAVPYERYAWFYGRKLEQEKTPDAQHLHRLFLGASACMRKGDEVGALNHLQRAREWQWTQYARNFVVPRVVVQEARRWSDQTAFNALVQRQLELVKDNLTYWAETKQSSWIPAWLRSFSEAIRDKTGWRSASNLVDAAAQRIHDGKNKDAKSNLEAALTLVT